MSRLKPVLFVLLLLCWNAAAGAPEDAKQLKDEALAILKANSAKTATPEEYATCIMKLEKAQALLDGANETDTPLAQEVSASLFWARRFSNVDIINALQKMRGTTPPLRKTPPVASTPAQPKSNQPAEPPERVRARAADKAFSEAQSFAQSGADNYAVALRWFQMAGEHAGTDAALKALELAREAQRRHMQSTDANAAQADTDALPDSPEMVMVKEADNLVQSKQFEVAIKLYRHAVKQKDSTLSRRRLAKALYFRAQQIQDELKPKFEANARDYAQAHQGAWIRTGFGTQFNPNDPNLARVNRETEVLRKEGDVAYRYFQEAEIEFKAIVKAAEKGRDFEAAGYIGLCQCVRPFFKLQGQNTLKTFVKDYTPANDFERTLYEFCKAEIERIRAGK